MSDEQNLSFHSQAAHYLIEKAVEEARTSLPPNIPDDPFGDFTQYLGQFFEDITPFFEKTIDEFASFLQETVDDFVPSLKKSIDEFTPELEQSIGHVAPHPTERPVVAREKLTVCIIGAGAAGLRTAMFLDKLGIEYDILEAAEEHGGRLFTYRFQGKNDCGGVPEPKGDHDYFDVGAMRFPCIKTLDLTHKLFKELGLEKGNGLIPYHLSSNNSVGLYNDRGVLRANMVVGGDTYGDSTTSGGNISEEHFGFEFKKYNGTIVKGAAAYVAKALEPFKLALVKNFRDGWEKLMEFDNITMRDYLLLYMQPKLSLSVIQWMERMDGSTGAYDLAFTETVLNSIDFDYPHGPGEGLVDGQQQWLCVEGGAAIIADRMSERISKTPLYNHRVVGIRMAGPHAADPMYVKVQDHPEFDNKPYSHVITTPTLACLNSMDLTEAGLSYTQKQAIRCLGYSGAVKIGIKFKTRWWEQKGGMSSTDRPIRTVVYPSYGLDDSKEKPGVLMASYARIHDASRLGAYIKGKGTKAEKHLLDMVYNDLAAIHGKTSEWYREQTLDYFAFDWYQNEFTVGAFAHFRPSQFNHFYPSMTKPAAQGNLHFAGEAVSTHHGWVEGALASAWRAVYHILLKEGQTDLLKIFDDTWPRPEEVDINIEPTQMARGVFAGAPQAPKRDLDIPA